VDSTKSKVYIEDETKVSFGLNSCANNFAQTNEETGFGNLALSE